MIGPAAGACALAGLLLLGGCADGSGDGGAVADRPAGTPRTSSPRAADPSIPRVPRPTATKRLDAPLRTLRGTVQDGVEAGCRVLRTTDGTFQLLGAAAKSLAGEVTVTGRERADIATTCQQGTPFQVVSVGQ